MQDDDLRVLIDSRFPAPSRETNERIWAERWLDNSRSDYAILLGGVHIGNCGTLVGKPVEAWLYLATNARQRGIGREAVRLLLAGAEAKVRVLDANHVARRFWESVGFQYDRDDNESVWLVRPS